MADSEYYFDYSIIPQSIAAAGDLFAEDRKDETLRKNAMTEALFKMGDAERDERRVAAAEGQVMVEQEKLKYKKEQQAALMRAVMGTDLSTTDYSKVSPNEKGKSIVGMSTDGDKAAAMGNEGASFVRFKQTNELMENPTFVQGFDNETAAMVAAWQSQRANMDRFVKLTKEQASVLGMQSGPEGTLQSFKYKDLRNSEGQTSGYIPLQLMLAGTPPADKLTALHRAGYDLNHFPIDDGMGMLNMSEREFNARVYASKTAKSANVPFPEAYASVVGLEKSAAVVPQLTAIANENPIYAYTQAHDFFSQNRYLKQDAQIVSASMNEKDPRKAVYANIDPEKVMTDLQSRPAGAGTVQGLLNAAKSDPSKIGDVLAGVTPGKRPAVIDWMSRNGYSIPADIEYRMHVLDANRVDKSRDILAKVGDSEYRIPTGTVMGVGASGPENVAGENMSRIDSAGQLAQSIGRWSTTFKDDAPNIMNLVTKVDDPSVVDVDKARIIDTISRTGDPKLAFKQGNTIAVFSGDSDRITDFNKLVGRQIVERRYDSEQDKTVFEPASAKSYFEGFGEDVAQFYEDNRIKYDPALNSKSPNARIAGGSMVLVDAYKKRVGDGENGVYQASIGMRDALAATGADASRYTSTRSIAQGMVTEAALPLFSDGRGAATVMAFPPRVNDASIEAVRISPDALKSITPEQARASQRRIDAAMVRLVESDKAARESEERLKLALDPQQSYLSGEDLARAQKAWREAQSILGYNRLSMKMLSELRGAISGRMIGDAMYTDPTNIGSAMGQASSFY